MRDTDKIPDMIQGNPSNDTGKIPLDGEISKKCPKHAIDLPREDGIIPNELDKSLMGEKNILFIGIKRRV